jgi:hypothetical protein
VLPAPPQLPPPVLLCVPPREEIILEAGPAPATSAANAHIMLSVPSTGQQLPTEAAAQPALSPGQSFRNQAFSHTPSARPPMYAVSAQKPGVPVVPEDPALQAHQEKVRRRQEYQVQARLVSRVSRGVANINEGREGFAFACDLCSKRFSTVGNLRRHHAVHMGLRPYSCKFCGACFGNSSNRRKHELTHERKVSQIPSEDGPGPSAAALAPTCTMGPTSVDSAAADAAAAAVGCHEESSDNACVPDTQKERPCSQSG